MRRIALIMILCFILTLNICFAETSKIIYEENSPTSLTYTVCETTASPFGRLGKAFSKHIDIDGNSYYWIRLALGGENYLYYQMKLIIDDKEYILQEEQSPAKYQTASTTRMIMFCKRDGAKNYYVVPNDVVGKLLSANKVVMVYRTQDSEYQKKEWNNSMISKTKEIINAIYNDKIKYKQG